MFRFTTFYRAAAFTLAATLALSAIAEAGSYPGNKCVAGKQKALGKYARTVSKAWDKYPADMTSRDAAISKGYLKLESSWTKEEGKAADKNSSCDESTATLGDAAQIIDDAVAAIATDPDQGAAAKYVDKALKTHSKYIKNPVKDPGKAKRDEKLAKFSTKFLAGISGASVAFATTLEADLVEATTTAPDYPTAFQAITPPTTVIYGKKTLNPSCVDGDPYIYFARKGSSNNVLMYYQGGGACWNPTSCYSVPGSTCKRTASLGDNPDLQTTGFANYANPGNPFADWNVVFVTYCTCDVHWGENAKTYGVGQTGRHFGRMNAAVAEKFAREHFLDPDRVFVTGSSAGSYGAIMNSYWLMKDVWPNADFAVLGDAGVGVITQNFLDEYIDNWGVDKNFPEDLPGVELPIQNLSLVDLIDGLSQAYPNARFGNYDSSYDGGSGSQCNFFQVMRHPSPPGSFITDWPRWYDSACEWNACMRAFKEENATRSSNYHYFTGAGTRHTMFGSDKVYVEDKSTKADGTPVTIAEWVNAMIDNTADWVDVDCENPGGDCNLTNSCQGGTAAGELCSTNGDCGGGTCQHDPDTPEAPFNNDDTVNCPATVCPCGLAAAKCVGGANDGLVCTTDSECTGGSCVWVRCPTFTGP